MYYYINFFFINSFLGFLFETIIKKFFVHNMNNGLLFGPWIPIYGIGTIIIFFTYKLVFKYLKKSNFIKVVCFSIIIFIILSLLEFFVGVMIEKFFDIKFWDYSNKKYNIGPYISVEMSLLWMIFANFFLYVILPFEKKIIKKIPNWFTQLVFLVFIIDVIVTIWLI